MNTKNLMSGSVKPVNHSTVQNLAIDLVELSEKDLKRVVGGFGDPCGGGIISITVTVTTNPDGTTTTTTTTTYLPCTCSSSNQSDSLINP
jgi:hypothetical protein